MWRSSRQERNTRRSDAVWTRACPLYRPRYSVIASWRRCSLARRSFATSPSVATRRPMQERDGGENGSMVSLADAVLPLIRTRADLHRWSASNAQGLQMHQAVDVLEAAIPNTDPAQVYAVTHKALASAVKVIARADDSSGIIGDACRRLLALHPTAAAQARVPAARLVDWMITFQ